MTDKNLIFGIDVDNVLRDTISMMVKLYNEEFNDNKKYADVISYDIENIFPRILNETGISSDEWFFECHSEEIFKNSKAICKARKGIEILKKYGTVVIVTRQKSYKNKIHTIEWLSKNKMLCDDICFLKDKKLFHCDYLIDDYIGNFLDANTVNAILINAPHNAESNALTTIINNSKNIVSAQRYNSLFSFATDFENKIIN